MSKPTSLQRNPISHILLWRTGMMSGVESLARELRGKTDEQAARIAAPIAEVHGECIVVPVARAAMVLHGRPVEEEA